MLWRRTAVGVPLVPDQGDPSTLDLLITARRVLIAARFMPGQPTQPTPAEIRQVQQAWELAAA